MCFKHVFFFAIQVVFYFPYRCAEWAHLGDALLAEPRVRSEDPKIRNAGENHGKTPPMKIGLAMGNMGNMGKPRGRVFGKIIIDFFIREISFGWSPWVEAKSQMRSQCCDQVQSTWLISGIIQGSSWEIWEKLLEPDWIAALCPSEHICSHGHGAAQHKKS